METLDRLYLFSAGWVFSSRNGLIEAMTHFLIWEITVLGKSELRELEPFFHLTPPFLFHIFLFFHL